MFIFEVDYKNMRITPVSWVSPVWKEIKRGDRETVWLHMEPGDDPPFEVLESAWLSMRGAKEYILWQR